jgi:hypothetical protein
MNSQGFQSVYVNICIKRGCDKFPFMSLRGMKHKSDEFYRFMDPVRRNPRLRERLELKMRIIMPGVQRDIKRKPRINRG